MNTGIIGLGAMGTPMARNLLAGGYLTGVWNRTAWKAEALSRELGVQCFTNPAELAASCDLIITCVSRDADLEEVSQALLPGLGPGKVLVDTSTVSRETARKVAERVAERGCGFLDAPVSGGTEGARRGTLAMMVGGDAVTLEAVRGPLSAIAEAIVHIGPVGSGQSTKAVNQIMAAGINQAVGEALAFGEAMELPMDKVLEVVASGAAGNWFLSHRGTSMLAGRFSPGFRVALHYKDLQICRAMAEDAGTNLPLVDMTLGDYARLVEQGHGDEDISALYRLKRPGEN